MLAGILTLLIAQSPPTATNAESLKIGAPAKIVEIEADQLKGEPSKLAWSADGKTLYIEATERKRDGAAVQYHFALNAAGSKLEKLGAAPEWVQSYWSVKSGQTAPGDPTTKIELTDEYRTERATAAPMGGDLAKGGAGGTEGTSLADATNAASQSQKVRVITLKLRGQVIGEFINGPLVPGLTFGWAPQGTDLIAFAETNGRLVVMDRSGRKKRVEDASNVLLPAWSADGTRLAYVERSGRKKFQVATVSVAK